MYIKSLANLLKKEENLCFSYTAKVCFNTCHKSNDETLPAENIGSRLLVPNKQRY